MTHQAECNAFLPWHFLHTLHVWPQFWAKNSRTFHGLLSIFSRPIPMIFNISGIMCQKILKLQSRWFWTTTIQGLLRLSDIKFQNFRDPIWLSRTLQSLKRGKLIPDLPRTFGHRDCSVLTWPMHISTVKDAFTVISNLTWARPLRTYDNNNYQTSPLQLTSTGWFSTPIL